MPTSRHGQLLFFFLLLLLLLLVSLHHAAPLSPAAPPMADANATAHDILAQLGFPRGLLPGNVASCTLSDDGDFRVQLSEPCYVLFSDPAYFEKNITGKITKGLISGISGIQVRKFFIWVSVTRVAASEDGGTIVFSVGFLSETHLASEFADVRACEKWGGAAAAASSSSLRRGGGASVGIDAA